MPPLELLLATNASPGTVSLSCFSDWLTGGSKRHELMHGMLIAVTDKEQASSTQHAHSPSHASEVKKLAAEGMG